MTRNTKKVVFLMGSGHCGSTLLDLILGSHSTAFSLGEFNRISKLVSRKNGDYIKRCGVCEGECPFWNHTVSEKVLRLLFSNENVLQKLVSRISGFVISPYTHIFKCAQKSVLIDSSKKPSWYRRQLSPAYKWHDMTPYLIYMLRDGRAVVNSYYRKYPERGIENIIEKWKHQMVGMDDFYKQFPENKKMKVHYEQLATEPEQVIRSICNFIGIEFEREMLSYWIPEHHHIFGNAGTRSLIYKFREQFGYQMTGDRQENEQKEAYYGDNYYKELNLAIKLDKRWERELTAGQLDTFDKIAGDMNRSILIDANNAGYRSID